MKTLVGFILGKNPELSKAEILSYLSGRGAMAEIEAFEKDFLVLGINGDFSVKIEDLGGSIKVFGVLDVMSDIELDKIEFRKYFDLSVDIITFGLSFYGVGNWQEEYQKISKHIKTLLRSEGIKTGSLHLPENRSYLEHLEVINKKLIKNGEIIFCFSKNKYYIGKTLQVHNPLDFQKRDVGRPEQRAIFSIPPRLAKIMINLLEIKEGTLLDPFCGIGTILQEAALMGFDIKGVDINNKCVEAAKKNIIWLEKEFGTNVQELDKKIVHGDSRKLSNIFTKESIDGIVTEPYLGPPIKGTPTITEARVILSEIEDLYIKTLKEANIILRGGSRVCIVSPRIKTDRSDLSLNMKDISRKAGFDLIKQFTDSEERHKIIREINILEKV